MEGETNPQRHALGQSGVGGSADVVEICFFAYLVSGFSFLTVFCVLCFVILSSGGRVLISGLTFSLRQSERMLIVGESGAGKSSLLRAMAGLWTTGALFFFVVGVGVAAGCC